MENAERKYEGIGDRVKGQFPLSIATSLAIESALGMHPDLPTPPEKPILRYDEIWINLRTLFRNLLGACPKGVAETMTVPEMVWGMLDEMDVIPDVLKHFMDKRAPKVVYYFSHYKGLERKYPKAILRTDTTAKQQDYTKLLTATMAHLIENDSDKFRTYDLKITDGSPQSRVAIVTSHAYDLLSANQFQKLTLLESHTGKFKSSSSWHSKYYQGKDLAHIPFREDFLQVYGDSELFSPMEKKLRIALLEVATRRKWSSVTTSAYIKSGIDELKDPLHKDLLRSILV